MVRAVGFGVASRPPRTAAVVGGDVVTGADETNQGGTSRADQIRAFIVATVAVAWGLWQMKIAATLPLAPVPMRTIHLSFGFFLAFLIVPGTRRVAGPWLRLGVDLVLGLLSVVVFLHLKWHFAVPDFRRLLDPQPVDTVLAWTMIALVLVVAYRAAARSLAIGSALFLLYAFFGELIPGPAGHAGFSTERVLSILYLRLDGILGVAVGASATLIFPVMLFGALLVAMGGGEFFAGLSTSLLGHIRGGSAKMAVFASALFGTVSGTGAANVASTGVFTIPLMKRAGYTPPVSAAIEATASIGGQITPPIMGAAAFVMADFLGVPYGDVVRHAIVPALLFYGALLLCVDLEACKTNATRPLRADRPPIRPVLASGWQFALPLVMLIVDLGVLQRSVPRSAFRATVLLVVLDLGRRVLARHPLDLRRLLDGAVAGAKGGVVVATAVAAVQLVIATVDLTGIGLKLSSLLVRLAGGELWLLLVLAMLASLLLGTGLPTVPTYLILAILTAPALTELGVPLIAAHFFVFYFGAMADLTPPTALGAVVASGIAGANPSTVMKHSMRLGLVGFILPFMFVYSPALLLEGPAGEIAYSIAIAMVGVTLLAVGLTGYLFAPTGRVGTAGFLVAALLMIHPHALATAAGLAVGVAFTTRQVMRRRQAALAAASGAEAAQQETDHDAEVAGVDPVDTVTVRQT
jgi:TRAP transporter 4TM/12TM fusion protein